MLALVIASATVLNAAPAQQQTAPDNTGRNKTEATTAEQQKNNKSDLETTRRIRKAIVDDKTLSTYAHNVKIVTEDGQVNVVDRTGELAARTGGGRGQGRAGRGLGQGDQPDGSGA